VVLVAWVVFAGLRQELTPPEDRSLVIANIQAPQGVSLDFTESRMHQLEQLVTPLRETGEIVSSFSIAGWRGSSNRGFISFTLAPWEERTRSQQEIAAEVGELAAQIPGIRTFIGQSNSLGIRGAGSGLQFAIAG